MQQASSASTGREESGLSTYACFETGLAQCAELCWQLRGLADLRQVPNAKLALQHNIGLGGAAVVTMYQKYKATPAYVSSQLNDR